MYGEYKSQKKIPPIQFRIHMLKLIWGNMLFIKHFTTFISAVLLSDK